MRDDNYICSDKSIRFLLSLLAGKRAGKAWEQFLEAVKKITRTQIRKRLAELEKKRDSRPLGWDAGKSPELLAYEMSQQAEIEFHRALDGVLQHAIPGILRSIFLGIASARVAELEQSLMTADKSRGSRLKKSIRQGLSTHEVRQKSIEIIRQFNNHSRIKTKVAVIFDGHSQADYKKISQKDRDRILRKYREQLKYHNIEFSELLIEAETNTTEKFGH